MSTLVDVVVFVNVESHSVVVDDVDNDDDSLIAEPEVEFESPLLALLDDGESLLLRLSKDIIIHPFFVCNPPALQSSVVVVVFCCLVLK